jgi:hypothetical protein
VGEAYGLEEDGFLVGNAHHDPVENLAEGLLINITDLECLVALLKSFTGSFREDAECFLGVLLNQDLVGGFARCLVEDGDLIL